MHGEFLHCRKRRRKNSPCMGDRNNSDMFRFGPAAFYQSLKNKVGLATAKTQLRMNLNNIDSYRVVA